MSEAGRSNSSRSCDARRSDCRCAITAEMIVRINQMKQASSPHGWRQRLLDTGARSGNRTRIPFRMRDFKSLASTNFAIRAWMIARRAVAAQDYNERLGRVQL